MPADEYAHCKEALEQVLLYQFGLTATVPFGEDTLNPGVKADFDVGSVGVHLALWTNCSFDVEALNLKTGEVVLNASLGDVTAIQVRETLLSLSKAISGNG